MTSGSFIRREGEMRERIVQDIEHKLWSSFEKKINERDSLITKNLSLTLMATIAVSDDLYETESSKMVGHQECQ